jgi:hypothetical protein
MEESTCKYVNKKNAKSDSHPHVGIDLKFWKKALRDAECELEAATRCSNVNDAAKRLQRAETELKRPEAEAAKRPKRASRGSRSAGAS